MVDDITRHIPYLCDHLTNIEGILIRLLLNGLITWDEKQKIDSEPTDSGKTTLLLSILSKRDWLSIKGDFLEILKITLNPHCAAEIEKTLPQGSSGPEASTPANSGRTNDFTVTAAQCNSIAKIIQNGIGDDDWKVIMEELLINHRKEDILKETSLSLRILKTLKAWVSSTKKEDRLYSKLIEVIKGNGRAYLSETLKEESANITSK